MSAATSAFAGNDPSVSSSAIFYGSPGPYTTGDVEADSEIVYFFGVFGPAGGPVAVQLTASGRAATSNNLVVVYSSLEIVGSDGFDYSIAACAGYAFSFCNASPDPSQFSVSPTLQLTPNEIYEVVIETNLESYSFPYPGPVPSGAFSASGFVDPTLQLAPGVSDQYQLITSSNLTTTPEPASFLLAATGALALFVVRRQTSQTIRQRT